MIKQYRKGVFFFNETVCGIKMTSFSFLLSADVVNLLLLFIIYFVAGQQNKFGGFGWQ